MHKHNSQEFSLYEAILSLKTEEDCEKFLQDICTPVEKKALSERWRVAQLLSNKDKELSYKEIHSITGVSIATITRVARFLLHESYNGYKLILNKFGISIYAHNKQPKLRVENEAIAS